MTSPITQIRNLTGEDWFWIGIAALIVIGAGAELLSPAKAGAHEWYPAGCCSDRDCRPVPENWAHIEPHGATA